MWGVAVDKCLGRSFSSYNKCPQGRGGLLVACQEEGGRNVGVCNLLILENVEKTVGVSSLFFVDADKPRPVKNGGEDVVD